MDPVTGQGLATAAGNLGGAQQSGLLTPAGAAVANVGLGILSPAQRITRQMNRDDIRAMRRARKGKGTGLSSRAQMQQDTLDQTAGVRQASEAAQAAQASQAAIGGLHGRVGQAYGQMNQVNKQALDAYGRAGGTALQASNARASERYNRVLNQAAQNKLANEQFTKALMATKPKEGKPVDAQTYQAVKGLFSSPT